MSRPADAVVDVLGEPYLAEEILLPDDAEGPVVATLVRRRCSATARGAVLHVHGFADYFFHTAYAEWWCDRGYDFYALDLRKYGRSLRPHQTPNYVADLAEYFPDLDAAWERITGRDGHERVVVSAHSTGGLTTPLWADERRPAELVGMVLNSPWFDLQGNLLARTVGSLVVQEVGRRAPMRAIPRKVSGLYARSLHRDHEGEWDFDLAWKPVESFAVHAGWLRAVRRGHAALHAGLSVPCPVLVLSSGATARPTTMCEDVHCHDIVLEVAHIRRWAGAVGPHVTYVAVPGARHDVVLSRPAPRAAAYDAIGRWHDAWVG
ncbi:alpha/beta hydrolase [Nocardioides sp. SYSU DS0663]|uniref:alpha/beta hydrolase n=1 Tax=Nocardioides sp. SYSU DS0663 TaxID=3416445 RepID=UPI003F4B5E03